MTERADLRGDVATQAVTIAERLVREARGFTYEALPPAVVREAKRRIIDTVACAVAGSDSAPSRALQALIRDLGGRAECTIIGSGLRTSCMNATLVNGAMVRFSEAMDTNVDHAGSASGSVIYGHFDEVIPGVLAVGERARSSGRAIIAAVVLGYELFGRIARAAGGAHVLEQHGFKSEIFASLIMPIVVGKLLDLTDRQMVNAIGVAGSYAGALALLDDGAEEQTMARNLRFPMNAHHAILATLMAQHGFEGPARIYEGHNGFIQVMLRGQFRLDRLASNAGDFFIQHTWTKAFPVSVLLQGPTEALIQLVREHEGLTADRISRIRISASPEVVEKGNHPTYRYPQTKETADKSACYVAALVVVDRDIHLNLDQFTPERMQDPRLRAVIDKVELVQFPDWSTQEGFPAEAEITTVDGVAHRSRVAYPRGHERNPLTDDDLNEKFRNAAARFMGGAQIDGILRQIDVLDRLDDIGAFTRSLVFSGNPAGVG